MNISKKGTARRSDGFWGKFLGAFSRGPACLLLCLLCVPLPALAGESVVWNGAGAPGTTGTLRRDPSGGLALYPDGPAGNQVTVNADISGSVHGGLDYHNDNVAAAAVNNSVTVNGGSVSGFAYGGSAESQSGSAAATGNSLTINGGSPGRVFGGHASSNTGTAEATGNSVIINGGSVNELVYGGYAFSNSGTSAATGNSVTLSGAPAFGGNSDLYGGYANNGDNFSGNTLNVWNYAGSPVRTVQSFQHYNFLLPAAARHGATLLRVTDTAWFDDSRSGIPGGALSSVSGVNILGGGTPLQTGDSVILVRYATLGNNAYAANGNSMIRGQKSAFLLYDWQLSQTATALTATVAGVQAHPRAKALSEGRLAGLAFLNQGSDLIAGTGMDGARRSASRASGITPFFAGQGGASRYDTGSHVDVNGFSLMTGLAWNNQTEYGKLLLGAFFEAGWGNSDSHNSFSGYASVKGAGDTEYYGGGILSRFDFANTGPGKVYAEASFRAGRTKTDFSSSDLRDPFIARTSSYDSGSAYYGAHLGLGYVWNVTQASSLDLYAKYFRTRQESDSVSVIDAPVRFKSAGSHRWRGGARFSHTLATESGLAVTPYIGAAYEHEFDGEAKATIYGYSIDAPDLKGGTGIGELGFSLKPSADSGLSFDLAGQGYTGVREGVTGSFQLKWEF